MPSDPLQEVSDLVPLFFVFSSFCFSFFFFGFFCVFFCFFFFFYYRLVFFAFLWTSKPHTNPMKEDMRVKAIE